MKCAGAAAVAGVSWDLSERAGTDWFERSESGPDNSALESKSFGYEGGWRGRMAEPPAADYGVGHSTERRPWRQWKDQGMEDAIDEIGKGHGY